MMAASILHKGTVVLTHVPRIQDVFCMMGILESMGCVCSLEGHTLTICTNTLTDIRIPENYIKAMRSSIVLLGALLGRCGEAVTSYPGGCSIGKRPVDLHFYALRQLGAQVTEEEGRIAAFADRLKGGEVRFSFPSLEATQNALLTAVLDDGITVIDGAAREPGIETLCEMLNSMGARITGGGTEVIRIEGVESLHDITFEVPGDRIVAGTYLTCVMAAGGEARLKGVRSWEMKTVFQVLTAMGAELFPSDNQVAIRMKGRPKSISLKTEPYPGFPTDLQSPVLSLLSIGTGEGRICETVFEGRFATAGQLRKMGAKIQIKEKAAIVAGTYPLTGCQVEATDLRGGAALVAAGLSAGGQTVIHNCRHIERGYENICLDLQQLGAEIRISV